MGGVEHLAHLPHGGVDLGLQVHDADVQLGDGQQLLRLFSNAVGHVGSGVTHLHGGPLDHIQNVMQLFVHSEALHQ